MKRTTFALLVLLLPPNTVEASTLTYPGVAPCNTTLQNCINAAAEGDTVEIATNNPINESPSILKSLTLRSAAGFSAVLSSNNFIIAINSGSAIRTFTIQGITLQRGGIRALQGSTGKMTANIFDNVVQETFRSAIEVQAGTAPFLLGEICFAIDGNELHVTSGDDGILVDLSSNPVGNGEVRGNRILMEPNSQQAAIFLPNGAGSLTVDVIGNTISGSNYDLGIFLFQFAPNGNLTSRVVNNLVTGQNGNVGSPGAIVVNVSQGAAHITALNNTVADNRLGIFVTGRADLGAQITGRIANNIAAHNSQAGLVIDSDFWATVTNGFNLVFGDGLGCESECFPPGPGTIFDDPLFAGPDDFHLTAASPAVDAGNDADVPGDITTDLDGNPRIVGAAVDMGAFELQGH
jgi:hypothetical protein